MRAMGELSDVPIEPPEQTRLLDACCSLVDVIGAGVPGGASFPGLVLSTRSLMLFSLQSWRVRCHLGVGRSSHCR